MIINRLIRTNNLIMRQILFFVASVFLTLQVNAQVPDAVNYQGIAKNSSGQPASNTSVQVVFKIRDGGPTSPIIYEESHNATTNQVGLFTVEIGRGSVAQGDFATIPWATGDKYIDVDLGVDGSSPANAGTYQLLSVPYALYAREAGSVANDKDQQTLSINMNTISISNGNQVVIPNLVGLPCWDTNSNGAQDPSEDVNGDGSWDALDCAGSQGAAGPAGPAGPAGAAGPSGAAGPTGPAGAAGPAGVQGATGPGGGLNCWDLNANGAGDPAEDINGDGAWNALDCQGVAGPTGILGNDGPTGPAGGVGPAGPVGPAGTQGPTGPRGIQGPTGAGGAICWDLNVNGACDLATEDINSDGTCNALDCVGPDGTDGVTGSTGARGTTGPPGPGGGSDCWDLNNNTICDLATEDRNGDGSCDALDCRGTTGPAGTLGATGSQGVSGLNCWDANSNGICDPSEDINGGGCDYTDCVGPSGARGAAGTTGPTGAGAGAACWDLNASFLCDLATEDINGDGACDVLDCRGAAGPTGIVGSTGPAGPLGGAGARGPQGNAGPAGPTGSAGPAGARGPQGILGNAGPTGPGGGTDCWDLNANLSCDLATEDINGDGTCDALDCKGVAGPAGIAGPTGPPGPGGGLNCWDLNGNGVADIATEDTNGDGSVDINDCRGVKGPTGPIGVRGSTGPAGTPGTQGSTGTAGPQGPAGGQGPGGPAGPTGPDGPTGAVGTQGSTGPAGIAGLRGSTGPQGPAGIAGPQGATGAIGVQGSTGPAGNAGPIGPQGVAGATGPIGIQGPTGPVGSIGPIGPQGVDGPTGLQGPQGATGTAGPRGPTGVAGADGTTGSQGPIGPAGTAGPTGSQGVAGTTGSQGPAGAAGAAGPSGAVGPMGAQGVTGPAGTAGPSGPQGIQGIAGPAGPAGPSGPAGAAGPQGPTGLLGVSCWDINNNGVCDTGTEDTNTDGVCNSADCLGGSGSCTGTNGLTAVAGAVGLGGTLIQNTTVALGSNDMVFDLTGTGEFSVANNGSTKLLVAANGGVSINQGANPPANGFRMGAGDFYNQATSFSSDTILPDADLGTIQCSGSVWNSPAGPASITSIPTGGFYDMTFTVPSSVGILCEVEVEVDIFDGAGANDIEIYIKSPLGTVVQLTADNGGNAAGYYATSVIFDDFPATTSIASSGSGGAQTRRSTAQSGSPLASALAGFGTPVAGNLSSLSGENSFGNWTVRYVNDGANAHFLNGPGAPNRGNRITVKGGAFAPPVFALVGEASVTFVDGSAVVVMCNYSADPTLDDGIVLRLSRSTTAGAGSLGSILGYSADSPHEGSLNNWVNSTIYHRDNSASGLTNGTTYHYKLWKAGPIESNDENWSILPVMIAE